MSLASEPLKAVSPEDREAAVKTAMAAATARDAMNALISAFPDLETEELHAGMLHARGATWAAIQEQCRASKATISKRVNRFYEVTKQPRADRRQGLGTKYHLDEARDQNATR